MIKLLTEIESHDVWSFLCEFCICKSFTKMLNLWEIKLGNISKNKALENKGELNVLIKASLTNL